MQTSRAWIGWRDRRLLKTGLLLLALLFQGYIGQAHFHNLAAFDAGRAMVADGAALGPGGNAADLPANRPDGHNSDCTICHLTGIGAAPPAPPFFAALLRPSRSPLLPPDSDTPTAARTGNHSPRGPPSVFVQS